VSLMAIEN